MGKLAEKCSKGNEDEKGQVILFGKMADKKEILGVEEKDRTKRMLQVSGMNLWLNDYESIFSDFDPRPYLYRNLSDDFLTEAKKISVEKSADSLELNLLIPGKKRDFEKEKMIKKRLRGHFQKHFNIHKKSIRRTVINGLIFAAVGVALMFVTSAILYEMEQKTMLTVFMTVLFEPAGWFLFWEGMWKVVFGAREEKPSLDFYKKMSKCKINFMSF